jgi:hypothetical protein
MWRRKLRTNKDIKEAATFMANNTPDDPSRPPIVVYRGKVCTEATI